MNINKLKVASLWALSILLRVVIIPIDFVIDIVNGTIHEQGIQNYIRELNEALKASDKRWLELMRNC